MSNILTIRFQNFGSVCLVSIAALFALGGCGGGGSGAGEVETDSNQPPPPSLPQPTEGYIRDVVVSRYESGVNLAHGRYACCNDAITDDGAPTTSDAMVPGALVVARTHMGSEQTTVLSLDLQHVVSGAINSIDAAHARLEVMGHVVHLTGKTWIGDRGTVNNGATLAGFQAGELVEISGDVTADDDIVATRIDRLARTDKILVRGFLHAGKDQAFRLGNVDLDVAHTVLENFPAATPRVGDLVLALGDMNAVNGVLVVHTLRFTGSKFDSPASVSLRGIVSNVVSDTEFELGGHSVTLSCLGCEQDKLLIRDNALVQVDGSVDGNGVIAATRVVQTESQRTGVFAVASGGFELSGPIDSIDTENRTFSILGFDVQMLPTTRFDDEGGVEVEWNSIARGDTITANGGYGGSPGLLVASTIMEREPRVPTILSKQVTRLDPWLTVLGRAIETNAETSVSGRAGQDYSSCRDVSDLEALFTRAGGAILGITLDPTAVEPMTATRVFVTDFRCARTPG